MQEDYSSWLAFKMLVSSDKQMEMKVKIKFSRQTSPKRVFECQLKKAVKEKGRSYRLWHARQIFSIDLCGWELCPLPMDDLSEHV